MNEYIFIITMISINTQCFSISTSELENTNCFNIKKILKNSKLFNKIEYKYLTDADENALENNYKCNLIIESVFKMLFDAFLNSKVLFSRFTIKYLIIENNEIKFNYKNLPLKLKQYFNNKPRKFECINSNNHKHCYINIEIKVQLLKLLKELNHISKKLTSMIEILKSDELFCICTLYYVLSAYNAINLESCILNNKFSIIIKDNIIIINNKEQHIIKKNMPSFNIVYVSIFRINKHPCVLVYERNEIVIESKKNEKIINILFDALKPEKNDENSMCKATNLYLNGQLEYFNNNDICLMSDKLGVMTKNDIAIVFIRGVHLSIEFIIDFLSKDLVDAIKEMIYDLNKLKENNSSLLLKFKNEKFPKLNDNFN
ncbi:hypothetical protein TCON_0009 [Astathelohania contejeani]|uniref:Uncharacterized protein n=1 Tax=Astathelohania contejeani TaxID=164912 RepID=A0ABQ7I2U4_9MICR|nr:hypothetical protein TCON_0009 [Thelohania contejeani]